MKLVGVFMVVCGLTNAVAEMLNPQASSTSLQARSDTAKGKIFVSYQMCLNFIPSFVMNVTVQPHHLTPSLPYEFNATVLEILSSGFWLEVERTDRNMGWQAYLTVDWVVCFHIGACGDGIVYYDEFIWMPHPNKTWGPNMKQKREEAEEECGNVGGKLVNILDEHMYDVVYDYVKKTFSGNDGVADIWLAMNYNPTDKKVRSSDGHLAYPDSSTHLDWQPDPGYPSKDDMTTAMAMKVGKYSNSNTGFWNAKNTFSNSNPSYELCTKPSPSSANFKK